MKKIAFDCICHGKISDTNNGLAAQRSVIVAYSRIDSKFEDLIVFRLVEDYENDVKRYQSDIPLFAVNFVHFEGASLLKWFTMVANAPTATMITSRAYFHNESFSSTRRNTLNEEMNEKHKFIETSGAQMRCEWTFYRIPLLHVTATHCTKPYVPLPLSHCIRHANIMNINTHILFMNEPHF